MSDGRGRGTDFVSHIVMQKIRESATATVPVQDHRELRAGTLLSIVRQSGLSRSEFE